MSLPIAVTTDESVVRGMAESAARSRRKRPTSSPARCCASAADPPLPKARTLPPPRRHSAMRRPAATSRPALASKKRCLRATLSAARSRTACSSIGGDYHTTGSGQRTLQRHEDPDEVADFGGVEGAQLGVTEEEEPGAAPHERPIRGLAHPSPGADRDEGSVVGRPRAERPEGPEYVFPRQEAAEPFRVRGTEGERAVEGRLPGRHERLRGVGGRLLPQDGQLAGVLERQEQERTRHLHPIAAHLA